MSRIFISYRRDDSSDIVGRIYDHLVARLGDDSVFKDVDSIPLGDDFRTAIGDAIAKCEVLLAVIGPNWLDSDSGEGRRRIDDPNDFVRIELEDAIARDLKIIPALVRGADMPTPPDLPVSLSNLPFINAISIRPDPDFKTDISRLSEFLPGVSDSPQSPTPEKQVTTEVGGKALLGSRTVGCTMTLAIATSICMLVMATVPQMEMVERLLPVDTDPRLDSLGNWSPVWALLVVVCVLAAMWYSRADHSADD